MNWLEALDAREQTRRAYELKPTEKRRKKLAAEQAEAARRQVEARQTRLFPRL